MNRLLKKAHNKLLRKKRVRSVVRGTSLRPRLSVTVSNMHISAQIIDDEKGITLASSTTVGQKKLTGSLSEKAVFVGTDIAKKAKAVKVKSVVYDRNGKLYHGRIKALADAARAEGLEF